MLLSVSMLRLHPTFRSSTPWLPVDHSSISGWYFRSWRNGEKNLRHCYLLSGPRQSEVWPEWSNISFPVYTKCVPLLIAYYLVPTICCSSKSHFCWSVSSSLVSVSTNHCYLFIKLADCKVGTVMLHIDMALQPHVLCISTLSSISVDIALHPILDRCFSW